MLYRVRMNKAIPLLTLILFTFFVNAVHAEEIKAYPITDYQEFIGDPYLPTILYYKFVTIPWKEGRVLIAGNPDGTGDMDVGVQIEVYGSNTANSFKWYAGCDEKPMKPLDITHLMGPRYPHLGGDTQLLIRYSKVMCSNGQKFDGVFKQYYDISPAYVVHFDDAPDAVTPFLDLPWDYAGDGNSFADAALKISSYFDHAYPLLSTNLIEPPGSDRVIMYTGKEKAVPYSSHDGYDWARAAGAVLGDPVLAAAGGTATFKKFGACGNMIMIDHGNDFQTRYCHLSDQDLVTNGPAVPVSQGQMIGRVGTTGRVTGAHIHFMVIQDKDRNGNFDDNIPDGLVDPFGWDSYEADPWETYSFTYAGQERTGNKSRYLFTKSIPMVRQTLTAAGKLLTIEGSTIAMPSGIVSTDSIITAEVVPPPLTPTIPEMMDGTLSSIGTALEITLGDGFGDLITKFSKNFSISMKYQAHDIERIDPKTLAIYSSPDGVNWTRETSTINSSTNIITTDVNHLTQFVIMGEKLDGEAPVTESHMNGNIAGSDQYFGDVTVTLTATDGPTDTSQGIEMTMYQIDGGEMQIYEKPISINLLGSHTIHFYSIDRDGNEEAMKEITFSIVPEPTPTPSPTPTPTATMTPSPTPTPTSSPTLTPTPTTTPKVKRDNQDDHHKKTIEVYITFHKKVMTKLVKEIHKRMYREYKNLKFDWNR